MIRGIVTADREAVIRLQILDPAGNPTDMDRQLPPVKPGGLRLAG
ncbi:MAG: hypothetical protein JWN14_551, partial [Chthonomonadales bacterium]|nr:hypothetical protein [Chthonomonadales bacterium]